MLRRLQRGDTLIEVLFAITVLSLAIVMSLSIMNQGTATSVRSLQITLVRQEIDSQADTLRFLNAAYIAAYADDYAPNTTDATTSPAEEYYKIIQAVSGYGSSVSTFGGDDVKTCQVAPDNTSFIVNTAQARYVGNTGADTARFTEADTFSKVDYTSGVIRQAQGIWIEAVRSGLQNGNSRYIDFHIRACWSAPGTNVPMNLGTIVRLYEPANA